MKQTHWRSQLVISSFLKTIGYYYMSCITIANNTGDGTSYCGIKCFIFVRMCVICVPMYVCLCVFMYVVNIRIQMNFKDLLRWFTFIVKAAAPASCASPSRVWSQCAQLSHESRRRAFTTVMDWTLNQWGLSNPPFSCCFVKHFVIAVRKATDMHAIDLAHSLWLGSIYCHGLAGSRQMNNIARHGGLLMLWHFSSVPSYWEETKQ